ncbi:MAG: hypothetical protein JJ713_00050 [Acidithiobacillus sp.]|uniref:hypothetical protein n=1 Tax=Acidithiobacillus sp. TaxID=1872118 RepID=UPI0025889673|nr:hypothetical protein [Acidithiobacillus sp.]MCE5419172.1 hypothetical protein [Acidithiobacillus sp.]
MLDYDFAATVLVECLYSDDAKIAHRYGITVRTIQNYRARMRKDARLSQIFAAKKAAFEREWASELAPAIREAIKFLQQAARSADPGDPEAIHAVAGALKILSEVSMTREVINARLAAQDRPQRAEVGALAAPATSLHAQA